MCPLINLKLGRFCLFFSWRKRQVLLFVSGGLQTSRGCNTYTLVHDTCTWPKIHSTSWINSKWKQTFAVLPRNSSMLEPCWRTGRFIFYFRKINNPLYFPRERARSPPRSSSSPRSRACVPSSCRNAPRVPLPLCPASPRSTRYHDPSLLVSEGERGNKQQNKYPEKQSEGYSTQEQQTKNYISYSYDQIGCRACVPISAHTLYAMA